MRASKRKSLKVLDSPPYWDLYQDGITQGSLARFLSCPERFRLAIQEGWDVVRGTGHGYLEFGSLVHEVIENIYSTSKHVSSENILVFLEDVDDYLPGLLKQLEARDRKVLESNASLLKLDAYQALEENYGIAEVMLRAYFKQWKKDFGEYEWIELEKTFDVPFSPSRRLNLDRPDIRIRGKRDGVFQYERDLYLFETKTKSRIEDEQIVDKLPFELQVQLYIQSIRYDYKRRPKGVVYNVIRRPQLRRSAKESLADFISRVRNDVATRTDFYFVRYEVDFLPEELQKFQSEFDGMMRNLIAWHDGMFHYRNSTACTGRMGICEFLPVCGRGDFSRLAKREHVFPELVERS